MEIQENEILFVESFEIYKKQLSDLIELSEGEFPKTLRLFDIRLRLALSLQIGFDNTISFTNTDTIRKIYGLILRLNDLWFVYEGLYKLCSESQYLKSNPTKSDPFTGEKTTELLLDNSVSNFGEYLNNNIYQNSRLKIDFLNYLQYLINNSKGATQLKLLNGFKNKATNNINPKFNEILSLIYALRNMYVHNTDTAKSGIEHYRTKNLLLKNCNDFMILISLKISSIIIGGKIEQIEQI